MEASKRIATNNIIMFSDGEITQLSSFVDQVEKFVILPMDSNKLSTMILMHFQGEVAEKILLNAVDVVRTDFDSLTVPMTTELFAEKVRDVIAAREDIRGSEEFSALKARMNRV